MMQEQDDINKKLPTLKNGAKSDHKSQADVDLERTEAELRVVKLALELITGICAELPEPEEGDLDGELDEDEEEIEEEWESDEDDNGMKMEEDTATTNDPSSNATGEIAKATKSIDLLSSIVPSCLRFIQPTGLSYPPSFQPSPHPPITSALCGVHIAALECLNNICLSIAELGRDSSNIRSDTSTQIIIEVWTSVWGMLATLGPPDTSGIGSGPQQRMQVWNVSLSVLWAVARILKGDPNIVPDEDKVKVLMEIGNGTKDEELIVMCLGILECMAVNPSPTSVPANKVISEYILSFLPASGRPVMVEAVIQAGSSMIDIFSDEAMPWDINFRQGKWELVLKASVDGFRKAVRSIDKRKEGGRDLRRRGDEVLENLIAFVKYRRSLKF
ncbi:hypothetical protein FRC16_004319 [Serendipita sp. 398]|nr:hypothetical protein FRC16_004319 [Serendipita sp. 398]